MTEITVSSIWEAALAAGICRFAINEPRIPGRDFSIENTIATRWGSDVTLHGEEIGTCFGGTKGPR